MRKSNYDINSEVMFLTLQDACSLFRFGGSTIDRLARECGARIKVGRSVRYHRERLATYIESMSA